MDDNIFIPLSKINEARRECVNILDEMRLNNYPSRKTKDFTFKKDKTKVKVQKNIAVFKDINMIDREIISFFDEVFIPLFSLKNLDKNILNEFRDKIGVEVNRVYFSNEDNIVKNLKSAKENGIKKAMAHTIGKIDLIDKMGFEVYTGFGTNVTNSLSIDTLEKNIKNLKKVFYYVVKKY